jgi:hypothetical protein
MEPNNSKKKLNLKSKAKGALSNNNKPQEKTHFQEDGPLGYHATKLPCYHQTWREYFTLVETMHIKSILTKESNLL